MTDWLDEVLDGKPLEAEMWKIGYIENLLHRTTISSREQEDIFNSLRISFKREMSEGLSKHGYPFFDL